jgi:hypothetical protein
MEELLNKYLNEIVDKTKIADVYLLLIVWVISVKLKTFIKILKILSLLNYKIMIK